MRILIPAIQKANDWGDLLVLTTSLHVYAPGIPVTVAWKGEKPPPVFVDQRIKQPDEANNYGKAVKFLVENTEDEELLIFNDDLVLTPTAIPLLAEDLKFLKNGGQPGVVGFRSNYVAGLQNIRQGGGELTSILFPTETCILEVPHVFGIAFWITRSAIESIPPDWMQLHWYSDNLLCHDLANKGYRHYVSRAYAHHHGSRSGGDYPQYHKEGMEWLSKHRPDFYSVLAAAGSGKSVSGRVIGTPEMLTNIERVPPRLAPSAGDGSFQ